MEHKYSHHFTDLLRAMGYTHCFFVAGGNIMHLLDSARTRMTCVPFVHEQSAAVAAEYFNQISTSGRAYALVTAGPGITNAMTGVAGAYLESRDLLIIGGQVKTEDLSRGALRQRGIQEIDGLSVASPVCKRAARIERPWTDSEVVELVSAGLSDRAGPVFIEFCLDAQGASVPILPPDVSQFVFGPSASMINAAPDIAHEIDAELRKANRPVLLIGGGVSFETARGALDGLGRLGVPLMTTWNGFDRVPDSHPMFVGRPNTWGQRHANVLLAQADLVVALGTRLGIQQTGFNWQEWGPERVIQVDVDAAELAKGHPRIDRPMLGDANTVLSLLSSRGSVPVPQEWLDFCSLVRERLPLIDPENSSNPAFVSPFDLVRRISELLEPGEVLIPASSGSGQFVPMEVFESKTDQRVVTNKGLASMGYGLAAALGASLAAGRTRTVLIEGDGSFSQSIQDLGTAAVQALNLKIFLLDNDGYASIRTTQRNYFGGVYMGCDGETGLAFPNWGVLADAFGIPHVRIGSAGLDEPEAAALLNQDGPAVFIVKVDPDQTYFPKVTSRISEDGSMRSNPIHHMTPELPADLTAEVFRYAPQKSS